MGLPIILGMLGLLFFGGAIAYMNFVASAASKYGSVMGSMVFFFMLLLLGLALLLVAFSTYRKRRMQLQNRRRR